MNAIFKTDVSRTKIDFRIFFRGKTKGVQYGARGTVTQLYFDIVSKSGGTSHGNLVDSEMVSTCRSSQRDVTAECSMGDRQSLREVVLDVVDF